jgi:GNAT superfamily N-acetyltransferase
VEDARAASAADFERVRQLRAEAAAEVSGRRGGRLLLASSRQPDPSAIPAHDDRAARLVVGTLDDQVVGYGAACVTEVAGGELLGVIDELYVEAKGRGVGVGEAMLRALMAWATSRGCRQMDGRALPGDRETKGLFERQGFSARLLVMSRALPAVGEGSDGGDVASRG